MNIFQKKVKEIEAEIALRRKQRMAVSARITKLIGIKPSTGTGYSFPVGKNYVMETVRQYSGINFSAKTCYWSVSHANENRKCGPNGCPVRKPVDYDKFWAALAAELKKKPR